MSDRNRYVYFLNGSGSLSAVALTPGDYTGITFASELEFKSGRSCAYQAGSNSIKLGYAEGTRIVWKDEELNGFLASAFPFGATPHNPKSINDILGDAIVDEDGATVTFPFVTMAPLQDLYLTSHQLMVHESFMPRGQRYALAKLSLPGGFGTTVQGASPSDTMWITLKEIDFQLRDYRGVIVPLLAPISFQIILEC